jgi:hypothetical protein
MKPALALIVLGIPAFLAGRTSLFDPARTRAEAVFERADAALRAQAAGDLLDLPERERDFARLLPTGYWKLLVEEYPDLAFERYAGRLDDPFPDRLVASWGIHALARLRHPLAKALLMRRAASADPEVRAHAIRLLRFYMDPSLTPWLLGLAPAEPDDYESHEVLGAVLHAATWSRPPDPAAVSRGLQARQDRLGLWAGTDGARLRLRVLLAADPLVEAERHLFPGEDDLVRDDFEEWLPGYVAHRNLRNFAPLLRRRVDAEIAKEREDEAFLDPAGSGKPLDPQNDAFWGFRGPFLLAAYRRALRDLGVPLTDEERAWLDRHRLLRPPREYLVEAGLLRAR